MAGRPKSVEELAEDFLELKGEVQLLHSTFVRGDLHAEQLGRIRDDLKAQRALSMWTLAILCSSILGAIVTVLVAVARGGS